PFEELALRVGRAGPGPVGAHAAVERELVHVVELSRLGSPGPLAIRVDEGVRQDAEQPGLEVGPRRELRAKTQGANVGFLHEILRVRLRSRHSEPRAVQRVDVRQRLFLEGILRHSVTLSERLRRSGHSRYARIVDRRRLGAIARRLLRAYGTPPPARHLPPIEEL